MINLKEQWNNNRAALLGPILIAIAAFLWATDFVVRPILVRNFGNFNEFTQDFSLELVNTMQLVFFEHLIAVLSYIVILLVIWRVLPKQRSRIDLNKFKDLNKLEMISGLFIGIGGSVLGLFFFTLAFAEAISAGGGFNQVFFVQKIQPLFALGFAAWLLQERLPRSFFIFVFIALAGAFVASFGISTFPFINFDYSSPTFLIALYALIAAFFWGTSTVFGRILVKKLDYPLTTLVRYVVGTIFSFIVIAIMGTNFIALIGVALNSIFELLYVSLIVGLFALFIYYIGLQNTKASISTISELTFPITILVVNHFINEDFSLIPLQWVGGLVVFFAITIMAFVNAKQHELEVKSSELPELQTSLA